MATDATGTRSVHNTLTTTTVDVVTLQGMWKAVEVVNRTAAGGAALWVTLGDVDHAPPTPSAALNEAFYVPAGTALVIENANGVTVQVQVKILGNGNDYSVTGLPEAINSRSVLV